MTVKVSLGQQVPQAGARKQGQASKCCMWELEYAGGKMCALLDALISRDEPSNYGLTLSDPSLLILHTKGCPSQKGHAVRRSMKDYPSWQCCMVDRSGSG